MPAYAYKALDARGRTRGGTLDAESPRALRALLRKESLFVTELRETHAAPVKQGSALGREVEWRSWFDRVQPRDVAVLTRQLATLLRAGIPLAEALQALLEQNTSQQLGRVLAEVRTRVNEGTSLAEALGMHAALFPELYVSMVRAGEAAGNLEQVLLRLADFMDAQVRLRGKVVGALTYPAVLLGVATMAIFMLMKVVVPKVTAIFADVGQALPWYTRLLVASSDLVSGYWWLMAALGIVAWQVFRRWRRTEQGRQRWDRLVLMLWLIGPLARMVAISRFARTLGTMLGAGVPLLQSLEIVKAILGNRVLMDVVDQARVAIREGESIAEPLARSREFPPVVTRMIAVGERSGQLEQMLATVADAYETEVDLKLGRLTTVLGPLMIVVMGGMIGFIVFAIFMPIFQMNDLIGGE